MKRGNMSRAQALSKLKRSDDSIRQALGEDLEPRLRTLLAAPDSDDQA